MSVRRCQQEVDSYEFARWKAYTRRHGPIGMIREDWRAAMVAHASYQPHVKRNYKINDFLLKFGTGQQSWQEMKAQMTAAKSAFDAVNRRNKQPSRIRPRRKK